jgi:hypothetical protein
MKSEPSKSSQIRQFLLLRLVVGYLGQKNYPDGGIAIFLMPPAYGSWELRFRAQPPWLR